MGPARARNRSGEGLRCGLTSLAIRLYSGGNPGTTETRYHADKTYDASAVETENRDGAGAGGELPLPRQRRRKAPGGSRCLQSLIPPPNVGPVLWHMGQRAQQYAAGIFWFRFSACAAGCVLWQPGMDHAGTHPRWMWSGQSPNAKKPSRPRHCGREAFIERVLELEDEIGRDFFNQLKRLGAVLRLVARAASPWDEGLFAGGVLEVFVSLTVRA